MPITLNLEVSHHNLAPPSPLMGMALHTGARRRLGFLCCLMSAARGGGVTAPTPAASAPAAPPERRSGSLLRFAATGLGGAGVVISAVPAARRSVLRLFGREQEPHLSGSEPAPEAKGPAPSPPPPTTGEGERFALTPDRLADIASLNPRLEAISEALTQVPVFTAAVGNGTSPLTVPTEDGRKLVRAQEKTAAL